MKDGKWETAQTEKIDPEIRTGWTTEEISPLKRTGQDEGLGFRPSVADE